MSKGGNTAEKFAARFKRGDGGRNGGTGEKLYNAIGHVQKNV